MIKSPKLHAYLVSTLRKRGEICIYAILATSDGEALAIAGTAVLPRTKIEIVGRLSLDLVKRLRLKPGEMRPV